MNKNKILALCLALGMLLGALSGCGKSAQSPESSPAPTQEASHAPETTEAPETDAQPSQEDVDALTARIQETFAAAGAKYDPHQVVCTVDGQPITWDMYFYLLTDELMTVVYYTGDLPQDYGKALTEDMSMEQYLKEAVLAKVKYYALAHTEAVKRGMALSQEQEQEIQEYMDHLVEQYGGEEALAEAMAKSNLSPELLQTILRRNEELSGLMDGIYGAGGEKMTAQDVLSWAEEQGYIRVKHILYYIFNDDGTEMDEAGKAEMKAKAEATLAELRAIEDNAALEARFDELMDADSGDVGGMMRFRDGYTFTGGTMYPVFEEAAFALEEYALSEVVESQSGYHVILRLPLDTEMVTMNQDANTGEYMSLRRSAANDLFAKNLAGWMESAAVEWKEGFDALDLNALFDAPGPEGQEK